MAGTEPSQDIQPSEYDLVVVGTGLTESIVAAAAAKAGKSVLQLDPSGHYGGAWASLRLGELSALLAAGQEQQEELAAAGIRGTALFQQPDVDLGPDGQYSIDLAPKVAYGAGPLIQQLLGSGAHNYLEFKLVQGSYLLEADSSSGGYSMRRVASSRSEVFKDRQLSPLQKRSLMRFFKAAAEALEGEGPLKDEFGAQPIQELLQQQGLDRQLQQALLHGVLLIDAVAGPAAQLTAADALERLRVFVQSVGRYGPDTGPYLTPLYGCGELPQAFCRVAAVAGAVQVLRCRIEGLVFDEHTFTCTGVELSSGQIIRCQQLAGCRAALQEWLATFQPATVSHTTHRCCAIMDGPLLPGEQQTLIGLLPSGQTARAEGDAANASQAVVRMLALSSSTAVCPPGKHMLHLWAQASPQSSSDRTGSLAVALLLPALAAVADVSNLQKVALSSSQEAATQIAAAAAGVEQTSVRQSAAAGSAESGGKPNVLWAGFYVQTSTCIDAAGGRSSGSRWPGNVALCPGPDSSATFASAVEAAKRCYWQLFPAEGSVAAAHFPLDPQPQEQPGGEAADGGDGTDGQPPAVYDSDEETLAALQAAMRQMAPSAQQGGTPAEQPQQEEQQ